MKHLPIFSAISITALLGGLRLLYADPATAWTNSVRVATTDQLIAAMLAAERTHESTEISVSPGHYLFTQEFNSNYGGNALPNVTTEILIVGANPATTIFELGGMYEFLPRFFTVLPSGNLQLRNLTLTGAAGTGACDPESSQDCSDMGGGAAHNIRGVVTITNCVLSGNKTSSGAPFGPLDGGAIESVSGILTIDHTTIIDRIGAPIMPPIMGAAIRRITSESVPPPNMMGRSPRRALPLAVSMRGIPIESGVIIRQVIQS